MWSFINGKRSFMALIFTILLLHLFFYFLFGVEERSTLKVKIDTQNHSDDNRIHTVITDYNRKQSDIPSYFGKQRSTPFKIRLLFVY